MAIVLLSGRTGSSKKEIAQKLEEHWAYARLKTYTTRVKITDEAHSSEYSFIDGDKFAQMKMRGHFLETDSQAADLYGITYGTLLKAIESGQDCVVTLSPNGVKKVRNYLTENGVPHVAAFVSDDTTNIIDRLMKAYDQNSLSKTKLSSKLDLLIGSQNSWEKDATKQACFDMILEGSNSLLAARSLAEHVRKLNNLPSSKNIMAKHHKAA